MSKRPGLQLVPKEEARRQTFVTHGAPSSGRFRHWRKRKVSEPATWSVMSRSRRRATGRSGSVRGLRTPGALGERSVRERPVLSAIFAAPTITLTPCESTKLTSHRSRTRCGCPASSDCSAAWSRRAVAKSISPPMLMTTWPSPCRSGRQIVFERAGPRCLRDAVWPPGSGEARCGLLKVRCCEMEFTPCNGNGPGNSDSACSSLHAINTPEPWASENRVLPSP